MMFPHAVRRWFASFRPGILYRHAVGPTPAPTTIPPSDVHHGDLGQAIDAMVHGCGLDPAAELGARVKLAICELYEHLPPGFGGYIDVVVRHSVACASLRPSSGMNCDCKRTVEIGFPDAGEPVIVH